MAGLAVLTLAGLLPARVGAQCDISSKEMVADGRLLPSTVPAGKGGGYYFFAPPNHSYSVEIHVPTGESLAVVLGAANVECPSTGSQSVHLNNYAAPVVQGGFRGSFTTTVLGLPFYSVHFFNGSANAIDFFYSVSDTTLYSAAWSTNGTYNTFYSLLNTTNDTCTGTLTLFSTVGGDVTSVPLSIPAGATASTNTQSLGTPRNSGGSARFTHDCPPGAFLAEAAIANFTIAPTPYFQFVHFQATRESGR
jgi:hypothetical protein